ncbi:MAG: sigma 54-interacting transcriptional regulator [Pseudomonadota bacterium]
MVDATPKRILIIEDEALLARDMSRQLKNMGYEVVGVAADSSAIQLARETEPDLLLNDIHLKGGEDGVEVATAITSERDVPVVFLTAYSDRETVERAKRVAPYGYIIKPVDNRELEIAIEIALYKFDMERQLRETRQLLENALTCIGNSLIFIDNDGLVKNINEDARRLLAHPEDELGQPWESLLHLSRGSSVADQVASAIDDGDVEKLAPFIVNQPGTPRLVDGLVGPMDEGGVIILRVLSDISDEVEAVPSEPGPDGVLNPTESALCQLMVGTIGMAGERALDQTAEKLNQVLRSTDLVSHYGDHQLAVSMPYTSREEGLQIAESLLTTRVGDETLSFAIGMSAGAPGEQQPIELFRRASVALNVAIQTGGHQVVEWAPSIEESDAHADHNKVLLLWNIMNSVVQAEDVAEQSTKLCRLLSHSLSLEFATVLQVTAESISLVGGFRSTQRLSDVASLGLNQEMLHQLRSIGSDDERTRLLSSSALLRISGDHVLLLSGVDDSLDLAFLETLVEYMSGSYKRLMMDPLPSPSLDSLIIHQSPAMQVVMERAQTVAATEANVVITGDSGTGKEMLARAIHESSRRASGQFSIVDCGAVTGTLIESELFGHVKGAFTGADRDYEGKLKQADGGTVLLDEIGEMPLDIQVKLLRFVQDRLIMKVGGSQYEMVDTRILAATHRDLKELVDQGLFREDLYFRLQVITIEMPPLRQRVDDIMLLARHYLAIYSEQYDKDISGFTPDAEAALLQHPWEGNVRELTNVINRGVIMCKDNRVSNIHLGLFQVDTPESMPELTPLGAAEWMKQVLADVLVENAVIPPMGRWLEEDLVLTCVEVSGNVQNRAAKMLNIPESTLRRKLNRLRSETGSDRPSFRSGLVPVLPELTDAALKNNCSALDALQMLLVLEVETRGLDRRSGATVLDVSAPTYRKLLDQSQHFSL